LPSLTFYGDTDTGAWRPSANNYAFSTAGTERARFDSSGNFGIGTTSPAQFLDIVKSQNAGTYLRVYNDNTGTAGIAGTIITSQNANIQILSHGGGRTATRYGFTLADATEVLSNTGATALLIGTNAQNIPIIFGNNSVEVMRIDTNQNLVMAGSTKIDFTAGGSIDLGSTQISDATLTGTWYIAGGVLGIGAAPSGSYGIEINNSGFTTAAYFSDGTHIATFADGNYAINTSGDAYIDGAIETTGLVNAGTGFEAGGSAGLSGTYTFDATTSGNITSMTFVGGILTAVTTL